MPIRTLVLGLCLLAGATACRAFPGHPVRGSQPRLPVGTVTSAGALPEPANPTTQELEAQLFLGVERLYANLVALRGQKGTEPNPRKPSMAVLPSVEKSVRERFGGKTPDGVLRNAIAVGVLGTVPITPAQMADLIMDPAVEKQVLAAAICCHHKTDFVLPGMQRSHYRVEMLRMGFGPMRYDLRFTVVFERRDLPDGRVMLRYDLAGDPRPEHVTLYRGGCIIEPTAAGSRVTEIVILGTDIKVPVFFAKGLRNLVQTTLRNRATNLWVRAWQGR
jgi:hypothetical protein